MNLCRRKQSLDHEPTPDTMNFTKIKFKPATEKKSPQVTLKYAEATKSGKTEEHTLKCDEAPRPELLHTLSAFRPIVMSACMLLGMDTAGEFVKDSLEVRSITIKRNDAGRSIVITALRDLDWIDSPLNLNTPLAGENLIPLPESYDGASVPDLLDHLEEEAARYVNGDRAQTELFEEDRPPVHRDESVEIYQERNQPTMP